MIPYYDAHNHLQDEWLAPHLTALAQRLPALGLRAAVVNGTCEADWDRVTALARAYPWVRASFGLHPWHVGNRSVAWKENFSTRLVEQLDAGVGEIGLDRWFLERARPDDARLTGLRRAPLDEQIEVFAFQLAIAAARNRPVTIHCIDAWGALAKVLATAALPRCGFLLHAYAGSADMIKGFADLGAYFSFNGSFLDDRKEKIRSTFKSIPFDRLLVETDAPAMPLPQPWRTHKLPPTDDGHAVNHPGNIEAAYSGLAATLGLAVSDLSLQVEKNFHRLFG